MDDTSVRVIGYIGTICATFRLIPQVYTSLKTRFVGVSLQSLLLDFLSCMLFLVYALYFKMWPFVISNSVSSVAALILMGIIFRKRRKILK